LWPAGWLCRSYARTCVPGGVARQLSSLARVGARAFDEQRVCFSRLTAENLMSSNLGDDPVRPEASRPDRLMSIDALRGFDMFWIVGGDDVARALGKWWGPPHGTRFAEQFSHMEWEGFRFYDLIFPLFLFLVGAVLPFSLRKYQAGEHPKSLALARVARRVV